MVWNTTPSGRVGLERNHHMRCFAAQDWLPFFSTTASLDQLLGLLQLIYNSPRNWETCLCFGKKHTSTCFALLHRTAFLFISATAFLDQLLGLLQLIYNSPWNRETRLCFKQEPPHFFALLHRPDFLFLSGNAFLNQLLGLLQPIYSSPRTLGLTGDTRPPGFPNTTGLETDQSTGEQEEEHEVFQSTPQFHAQGCNKSFRGNPSHSDNIYTTNLQ